MSAAAPKFGILCFGDPRDIRAWSGIPFHVLEALEPLLDIALVVEKPVAGWYRPIGRGLKALTGAGFQYFWSRRFTRLAMRGSRAALKRAGCDAVIVVSATPLAATLVDEFPTFYIADAVMPDLLDYYTTITLPQSGKAQAMRTEQHLLDRCERAFFSSDWARDGAIGHYGVSPDVALTVPFGANDVAVDGKVREIGSAVRLLFVGADYPRKGGDIALEATRLLSEMGVDCRLDVVGAGPEVAGGPVPDNVTFHGFVSKQTEEGSGLIRRLYGEATFLFVPTRAEAYGIVFAEAASHGLPSLSFRTGGVPTVVRDGETGVLLTPGSTAQDFADTIVRMMQAPERYRAMSQAALEDSRARLTWSAWAKTVVAEISRAMAR